MKKNVYLILLLLLALPWAAQSQSLTFSAGRGFYDSPFQLAITTSLAGATIRYTTDGSAPSTSTGQVYSGPITISDTRVIRAIGYSGATVTPVTTHTYLFLEGVIRQPENIAGWPNNSYALGTNSATARHDYEMDPSVVNNPAYSSLIKQGLTSIPTMSLVLNKEEFWDLYEGETKFPTSVEIFYPDGAREQFDCELESHSHNRLKRSLKLDINKSVTSELFRKAPYNSSTTPNKFKDTKIVLRGGNNRSWARNWNPDRTEYTRDEWYRISQQAISGTGGRGNFVHLYINGLYWGLYNPVERTDAGMLAENFGGAFADWMALDHDGIRHGDATRYNYLINTLVNKDLSTDANYAEFQQYLDVEKFSDYLIVTWMMGMADWPNNNYHGGMRNVPAGPFFYNAWDAEWTFDTGNGANNGAWVHPQFRAGTSGNSTIASLWHAARKNKAFMQTFADRVYKHCFNNGPLTDAAARQRWATVNNYIRTAIIAESARWGDAVEDGVTRTRDTHWTPEVNRVDGLMNGNVTRFINALVAQGYYPNLAAPGLSQDGGAVAPGFQLTLSNPNSGGTIYYTTEGSDPRTPSGAVAPGAQAYTGPISVTGSMLLKARVLQSGSWSPLREASFTLSGLISGLYINEFMATNTKEKDEFGELEDWIEIYNANNVPVNIAGLYLTDLLTNLTLWQIPATDPAATTIPAKGFIRLWADNQPTQGPLHINLKLSASGEQLGLSQKVDAEVKVLDSFTFGAQTADVSFGRSPDGGATFKQFFVPTPGSANVIPFKTNLYINEVLAGNQNSITDEAGEHDSWIEIFNNNDEAVDIGGLYLTNNLANPSLWKIPTTNPAATTIPAKGYLTLWADNQPAQGPRHLGFSLQSGGGQIGLSNIIGPDVVPVNTASYGSLATDVSWGRYPDAGAQVKSFASPTPAAANILPLAANLYINEFMASNTVLADPFGEFDDWIEIYNGGNEPVDIGGMYITDALTNPRKYQIPTSDPAATTIPAKGFLLLWADEQAVQGATHVGIKLGAGGEDIGLFQPVANGVQALDSYTFGAQTANVSVGRATNGGATFVSFPAATPGASNTGTNNPPQVQAGPDQQIVLPLSSATLAGSASDAEGSISTYSWAQVSGPNAALFTQADAAQSTVSGLVAGTYVFRLTATDNEGASAGDEVTVTVLPGGLQVLSFTLVDAASQRDLRTLAPGEILNLQALPSYGVNIRANTLPETVGSVVFNLSGALVKNATETGKPYALFGDKDGLYSAWKPAVGSYTLVATAYEGSGGTGQAGAALSLSFQVVDQPVEIPLANAGPDQQLTLPQSSLVLDGRGSGIPGREESFAWTQVSGPNTAQFSSFAMAAPTVSGLVAGTYVFSLVVTYQEHSSQPDQVTVTVLPDPVVVTAYRLNAGGSQVSNALGTFSADNYFSPAPGHTYSVTNAIAGTDNDAMYQNERSATADNGSFSYALPLSPGNYQVVLHFAELYWNAAGQRVFDVSLEGNTVLDNYDILRKAGGKFTAATETFSVQVADGTLDLLFSAGTGTGGVNRPSLAALEVIPTQGGNLAPTANAGADQTVSLPISGLVLDGSGSDADGSISAYTWSQVSGPSTALFSSTAEARPTVSGLAAGTYVFSLVVVDDQQATSPADQVVVTVNPDPGAPVVTAAYRLNAGGGQVSNALGTFSADTYFSPAPGYTYSVTNAIAGTENDAMYQNERSATSDNGSFSYALPLSNGRYKVVLHFAELYWTGTGKRIFDVNLEGNTVLDNYDIYKKAGAKYTAITESLLVNVSDGTLNLEFSAAASVGGVNRPSITALEVIPNALPLVQAGPDQQLSYPTSSVSFSGSATDPDGSIVSYSWTKESGPAATLAGTEGPGLSATGLQPGTYVFRLTATDNFGDTAFDEVTVTVAANQAPLAEAGADQQITFPASAITLTGAATDSDGSIVSYSWVKKSGPAANLSGANTPTLTASGLVIGSYVFGLTVSDEAGATGYDEVSVTVNPDPNAGPALVSFTLVNASNEQDIRTLVAGETLNLATLPSRNLNIRANTNPGVVGSVKFALSGAQSKSVTESGAPYALYGDNNGNYLSWTPALGSYTLTGTPYTGSGASGTAGTPLTISFTVTDQAAALPEVQAGADQTLVLPANSLTLTGSATDADGSIAAYLWTKQSGPEATLAGANTASLQLSGLVAGTYTFRLTATDNQGNTGFDEVTVQVQQPVAVGQQVLSFTLVNASTEQDIRTLTPGETINLASLPTQNLNIRANTNPETVGSVKFALSGPQLKNVVESGAPYALYGDKGGNYNAWVPAVGTYTLVATPYTSSGGGGTAGTPLSLSFTVVNQGAAARLDLSAAGTPAPAQVWRPFPNPSQDGRFQVLLPEAVAGEIAYELVSLSGARLAQGKLNLAEPAAMLSFDFSRQMQVSGMYYLKLQGERFHNQLKLMRK